MSHTKNHFLCTLIFHGCSEACTVTRENAILRVCSLVPRFHSPLRGGLKKHYLANNLINFIYIPGNEMLSAYLTVTSSE